MTDYLSGLGEVPPYGDSQMPARMLAFPGRRLLSLLEEALLIAGLALASGGGALHQL
jgi:hypothetical protein